MESKNIAYKSIKELAKSLNESVDSLENGNLSVSELSSVLQDARELHERIAILQYLSTQPKVATAPKEKPKPIKSMNFQLDFGEDEIVKEKTNQTNLLEAIEEEINPNKISKAEPIAPSKEVNNDVANKKKASDIAPVNLQKEKEVIENTETEDSLNDQFSEKAEVVTLAEKLSKKPIADLAKSIGLNQKFLFMNDLFEGENTVYKEALNKLNNFSNFAEASNYLATLKTRYKWDEASVSAEKFEDLIERRYS